MHSQPKISDLRSQISDLRSQISNFRSQISDLKFEISQLRSQFALALVVLVFVAAVPAIAADDASDTVVLGVAGNETFEFYKADGYTMANTPAAALAEFTSTSGKTRLLILKNAGAGETPVVGEWTWPSMTTPPGNLKKIEGGSLTKPYDVILHGDYTKPLFDFTGVGETDAPFVIQGVTLTGGLSAVSAKGTSNIELDRCYIREQAGDVAAVLVSGSATAKLTNCPFYKNYDGIVVDGAASSATLTHCTFYDNRASGIHVLNGGKATVVNSLMYGNATYGIWDESGTPPSTVTGSNSYNNASNSPTDNFNPVTLKDSTDDEAIVDITSDPWQGKLLPTLGNLSLKRGVGGSNVGIDFEGEGRSTNPYMGADELNANLTIGFWTRCEVYDEPVGRLGADVLIHYSGTIPDLASSLCLLPDGVTVGELAYDIEIPLEGGDGIYWGRVPEINDPILGEANGKTYIADSDQAQLVLRLAGGEVLDVLDDNTYILGQAIPGHKGIVIDTIPPVVDLNFYSPATLVRWNGSLEAATTGGNASFAARGPFLPPEAFPYGAIISGWPQMTAPVETHAVFAPYVSPPAEPPKFIYNIGSVANGYYTGNDWLFLTITATFIDPDVYTAKQLPADGFTRMPSGFNSVALGTETGAPANYFSDACLAQGIPAAWVLEDVNQTPLADPAAVVQFSCDASGGTGMTATWDVAIPVVGTGGPLRDRLDLLGDFIAQDKAGNYPAVTAIDRTVVPPLQITWLSGSDTQVAFRTRMYGAWPEVAWSLNDTRLHINRLNEANPRPIYSYNIWGARSYGQYNSDPLYEQLTGWSEWTDENVLSASFFDQNINDNFGSPITDRWLILVVAGCDEAGNVTPWDGYQWPFGSEPQSLVLNGDGSLTLMNFEKTTGRNWIRFYIPGKTTQIDTILYANLYYVDDSGARRDLGPAPIVSYPPPGVGLFAEFNARLLVNDPELWNGLHTVGLKFSAQQNGVVIFRTPGFAYLESPGMDMVAFQLPYPDPASGEPLPPQLGDASNVMTYTVSAAAVADIATEYPLEDQTPATFSFKVVPGSVDEYLRSAGGQQPVKQFETR